MPESTTNPSRGEHLIGHPDSGARPYSKSKVPAHACIVDVMQLEVKYTPSGGKVDRSVKIER
jgi:hypothetical protein